MSSASDYAILLDPGADISTKLILIEKGVESRLSVLLGLSNGSEIPPKFSYIVDEVVGARFSRLGNEGLKQSNQDGLTLVFQDDDFAKFKKEIDEYRYGDTSSPRTGRVTFL
ncbi:hypothetical protein LMG30237_ALEAABJJ_00414 [Fructobacillus tropaeoli]|uniref:phage head-tail connector protein n=1 Tax=Fructobacillus tropaeoli TaxID=709323 RepID=UPI002DACCFFE|nr:hypothetical protein LMG30237_ALEAABJJ_00414 [Fructobacillus tropaeoli]